MNMKEYLEATHGDMVPYAKGSSDLDEDNLSLNDPDDIQKNLARFSEITASSLYGELSVQLGATYLSPVQKEEGASAKQQVTGKIVGPNVRWIVDIPCRRETPIPPGVNPEDLQLPPFRHIFFVVDTSSPDSYLSVEAMQALSCGGVSSSLAEEDDSNDHLSTKTIPDFIDLELQTGARVEFHLSPGSNSEVNILGGSVLKLADLSTNVKDKEFILKFLD